MSDVFVSYAREDQPFVQRLHAALAEVGRSTWVDWEGIPPSALWMAEVRGAIQSSDVFVFVMSPDSIESSVCREEIEHAAAANKRIVPIVWRETDSLPVPEAISSHNWIFCREEDDFDEALGKLVAAMETDQESARIHTRLLVRATEWDARGRQRSQALRGDDLRQAEHWLARAATTRPQPTPLHTEYVLESRRMATRRQRAVVGAIASALLVSVVLSILALVQRGHAVTQARIAEQAALIADARRLAAASLQEPSLDRSLLMALAAVRLDNSSESQDALFTALLRSPAAIHVLRTSGGQAASAAAISPDGSVLAVPDWGGTVSLFDPQTLQRVGNEVSVDGPVQSGGLSFTPDSQAFAVVGGGLNFGQTKGFLDVVEVATHHVEMRRTFSKHPVLDTTVAFSPDQRTVATVLAREAAPNARGPYDHEVALLFNATTGRQVGRFPLGPRALGATAGLAFINHGRTLVTSTYRDDASARGGLTQFWDLKSGARVRAFGFGGALAVSPEGTTLAVGESVGSSAHGARVFLIDTPTGKTAQMKARAGVSVNSLAFTPDGKSLLTVGPDGLLRAWDVDSRTVRTTYSGATGRLVEVSVAPDGQEAFTASDDGSVIVWDLTGREGVGQPFAYTGHPATSLAKPGIAVNSAGTILTTSYSNRGTMDLWQLPSMRKIGTLPGPHHGPTNGMAFSPDGSVLATTGDDGTVAFWDVAARRLVAPPYHAFGGIGWTAAFSADGKMLVTGGDDSRSSSTGSSFIVWNAKEHRPIRTFHLGASACSAHFTPDGTIVAATAGVPPAAAAAWDIRSGSAIFSHRYGVSPGVCPSVITPDGRAIVAGDLQGEVQFIGVRTGQAIPPALVVSRNNPIYDVALAPRGSLLATSSAGVGLWDIGTKNSIGPTLGRPDVPGLVLFSPDGATLFDLRFDGTGTRWDVNEASWISRACAVAGRNLSQAEWHQLLTLRSYEPLCPMNR